MSQTDRLVLGTAQLGMAYGIANTNGQPIQSTTDNILRAAWEKGIRIVDTAQAYGDSETVIGEFIRKNPECRFDVISKLGPDVNIFDQDSIQTAVEHSQERLGRPLKGLMLHRFHQLRAWDGVLGKTLTAMKRNGDISFLGVSVYHSNEFLQALGIPDIESIQVPFNIFDRRLVDESLLQEATSRGRRVYVRSAFLQGLLVMDPEDLPEHMNFAVGPLEMWQSFCRRHQFSPAYAALQFIRLAAPDASVVIGCETSQQLLDNICQWLAPEPDGDFLADIPVVSENITILIDPSRWPKAHN